MQSPNYGEKVGKEYQREERERKQSSSNTYLSSQFKDNSAYLQHLNTISKCYRYIQELYCDYGMFLGGLRLKRIFNTSFFEEIKEFLKKQILPYLMLLNLRTLLDDKFQENNRIRQEEGELPLDYMTFFQDYIFKVICLNRDLHFFINYQNEILDRITDSDNDFNATFFLKDVPLLELEPFVNPTAISINFFYSKLREKDVYTQSNLPHISFINLDGFDNGIANFNSFGENSRSLQYISLFDDNIELSQKTHSTLDTFYDVNNTQRQKDVYTKHSLFMPLISPCIDKIIENQAQNSNSFRVSSGKLREVLRNLVFPLVRGFQPTLIILSHSLAMNAVANPNSPLSLNPHLFAEIVQQLSSFSNSKIIFCPRFPKNIPAFSGSPHSLKSKHLARLPQENLSFDEKYYVNSMNNYAFQSPENIAQSLDHIAYIYGAFVQVLKGQLNLNISKTVTPRLPAQLASKIEFGSRMDKYLQYIIGKYNPHLKQFLPQLIESEVISELRVKLAGQSLLSKASTSLSKMQQHMYNSLLPSSTPSMIAPETLSKQIHLAKFLNASPFISTGIYLVFPSLKEDTVIFNTERCQFYNQQGLLHFTDQTQHYVDYENKTVFLFNVPIGGLNFKHYKFAIPEYANLKDGRLNDFQELPMLPDGLNGKQALLTEFTIAMYKEYLFVIYGKIIKEDSFFNYFILKSQVEFLVSNEIFIINTKGDLSWQILQIIPESNCPNGFMPQNPIFNRLYPAAVTINKAPIQKKKTKEEPILFLFGGVFSGKKNNTEMPQLCDLITRLVPDDSDNMISCTWGISMLIKKDIMPGLRPLCNAQAVEVSKNQILLAGGTQNKYLTPLFTQKIQTYVFQMKEKGKTDNSDGKKQKKTKESKEEEWELLPLKPEQDIKLTNASLSSESRNIFQECHLLSLLKPDQADTAPLEEPSQQAPAAGKKKKATQQNQSTASLQKFFIVVNQDKYENEKGFSNLNNNCSNNLNKKWVQQDGHHSLEMDQIDCGFKNNAKVSVKVSSPGLPESLIENNDSVKKEVQDKSEYFPNINQIDQTQMNLSELTKGNVKSRSIAFSSINNDHFSTNTGTGIDQLNQFTKNNNLSNNPDTAMILEAEYNTGSFNKLNEPKEEGGNLSQKVPQNQINPGLGQTELSSTEKNAPFQTFNNLNQPQNNEAYQKQQLLQTRFQSFQPNPQLNMGNQNQQFPAQMIQNCIPPQFAASIGQQNQQFAPMQGNPFQQQPQQYQQSQQQSQWQQQQQYHPNPSNYNPKLQQQYQLKFENNYKALQQNLESERKVSSSTGIKIGILHVGIFYYSSKVFKGLVPLRITGGSFQDYQQYLQEVDENTGKKAQLQSCSQLLGKLKENIEYRNIPAAKNKNIQFKMPMEISRRDNKTEMLFAAQIPNQGYFHNKLYLITLNASGQMESSYPIEIRVNANQNGRPYSFSPSPDSIRYIQVSECGQRYFMVYQEKKNWHIYTCNHSSNISAQKSICFTLFIKYRPETNQYSQIKKFMNSTKYSQLSREEQKKFSKEQNTLLEQQQIEFEAQHQTNGVNILTDDQFLYLLSPRITKNMTTQQTIDFFDTIASEDSSSMASYRISSNHVFFPWKQTQSLLQLAPQKLDWFAESGQHDVKVAQSSTHIAIIMNSIFVKELLPEKRIYELRYKLIQKVPLDKEELTINESETVYSYLFTINNNLKKTPNIHYLQNNLRGDKINLFIVLIQEDKSLSDSSLAVSFVLPDFSPQNRSVNDILISPNGFFPFSSKFLFYQLPQPDSASFYVFDPRDKKCTNLLSKQSQ